MGRVTFPHLEQVLYHEIQQERSMGMRLNWHWIEERMKALVQESGESEEKCHEFKASKGWRRGFAKRFGLVMRKAKTTSRREYLPETRVEKEEKRERFLHHVAQLYQQHGYEHDCTLLIWLGHYGITKVSCDVSLIFLKDENTSFLYKLLGCLLCQLGASLNNGFPPFCLFDVTFPTHICSKFISCLYLVFDFEFQFAVYFVL